VPESAGRDELLRLVREEAAQVVDVLPRAEYEEAHLSGAINLPLKELNRETARVLDRDRPVVVYCHDYQ
jgi:rhodanese-related sulfurtransferase